ncbi:MAG: NAD-dependent epimerase/dehydratase family protein [Candidatus Omnitrophica bacterium]|nr:NAD-dependent epimerase/dehydratase family protein [Candidatus Omnitrophota bacterium]
MKILITGGAGLVGSHAAEYYAKKKWKVIVLDNLARSKLFKAERESVEYNWKYLAPFRNILRIKGDVRNRSDLKRALGRGVDVLLHAAGQPGVGFSISDPREDFSINAFGTLNVLEELRKVSPRAAFLFCSTNKIYGENVDAVPLRKTKTRYCFVGRKGIDETFPIDLAAHTPYGVSKYVADLYTQEYGVLYKMKTGVFRMSCIYGTRQFGFEDQGWVAHFVIQAVTGRPLTIFGDGKQVRDVLYVEDLVKAYDRFIQSPLKQGVFNIGGGANHTTSLLELLDLLKEQLPFRSPVSFSNWRASDQKVYISDIGKIKRQLGWSPRIGFQEGLERLIQWVEKNRMLFEKR